MLDVDVRDLETELFCVSDCSGNPAVKMARAKRALVFTRNCSEKRGIFARKSMGKIHAQKNVTWLDI